MEEVKIIHRINVKETLLSMERGQMVDIKYTDCKTETLRNLVSRLKKETIGLYEFTAKAKQYSTLITRL